jgi:hypothetical protein
MLPGPSNAAAAAAAAAVVAVVLFAISKVDDNEARGRFVCHIF